MSVPETVFPGRLFPGPRFPRRAAPQPAALARASSLYSGAEPASAVLKHLAGYAPFAAFVRRQGTDPAELAADFDRLVAFVVTNADQVSADLALAEAAKIFLGNTIAIRQPGARWIAYAGTARIVGNRTTQFDVAVLLHHLTGGDPAMGERIMALVRDWRSRCDGVDDPPVPVAAHVLAFVRPSWPEMSFTDADGAAIGYGNRWGEGSPPEDFYSVESHLERFAPLHLVADALIAYLEREYDVTVCSGLDSDGHPTVDPAAADRAERDLLRPHPHVLRAVRVTPTTTDAAPLTFVFTGYPGLIVHAGVLHDYPLPICGCDACDDTAQSQVGELERIVASVVGGGFEERFEPTRELPLSFALVAPDGSGKQSGSGLVPKISEGRLRAASARLKALPGAWQPWPAR